MPARGRTKMTALENEPASAAPVPKVPRTHDPDAAPDGTDTVRRVRIVSPGATSTSTGLSATHRPHDRLSVPGSS